MDSTFQRPATGPRTGQQYLDAQGRRWSVRRISRLGPPGEGGYCVLHLTLWRADHSGTSCRMTSREFFTMAASGGLRLVRA